MMNDSTAHAPLQHLGPGWFAIVMGLAGLALAWHAAEPVFGEAAAVTSQSIAALAAAVLLALATASVLRLLRHQAAWAEDLKHPVRHVFLAALPIALLLVVTCAVAAGARGPLVLGVWAVGAVAQWSVTLWVLSRWWRGQSAGGLAWAGLTPALFIPIVGNVVVPLAGLPLGQAAWSAAQFGVGVLFWPVVLVLLAVRLAQQGLWAERLLPTTFILVAPPAVVGVVLLRFGVPQLVVWALWGIALFSLLWAAVLLPRIWRLPFGVPHWAMSFPLAAFTVLTLQLSHNSPLQRVGVVLLALTSVLVAALSVATLRGLFAGSLLVAEPVPPKAAAGPG
jgi:tellurite resistance protein